MTELALGVADGEEASAIELLLEFHDDVRAGGFHSLVMRLDIADDNKGALGEEGVGVGGDDDVAGVVPIGAEHDHAVAEFQLGVGDAACAVRDDEMALEPEDVAEPVDGGEGVAVPHAGDDAGFQVCLVHRGLLESVGIERWVDGAMSRTPHRRVILDMDSSESPVHGEQEGASYNGHFGSMCYHPLFVFNQFGDCEGAMLRAGNVHSAHRWRDVLDPILSRYGATGVRRYFRADAAFAKPDIYEYLEERRVFYAIRLPGSKVLQWEIAPLLIRPVGRPPAKPVIRYDDCWYRAGSWDRARRVVAKVEWHRGELFPRVGFIVTNMTAVPEGVVRFYNGRGTAEQWIKEGKYALNWTRLSCHRFVANRVRLSLFVLAYNLDSLVKSLCSPN